MDYQHIRVTEEGDFTELRMCRPKARNALSEDHLGELLAAAREVGASKARGMILAGEGPVFCSGHDFSDMAGRGLDEMRRLLTTCAEFMMLLQKIPQVVLAQVEGLATAAGCQLVASCDLAVAGESARFAVPGGKGGWFCTTPGVALGRAVGRKHALEMLLTGDAIDAWQAQTWGLVNRVVPDAKVAEEARELLRQATRGSALSKGIGKQAFHRQMDLELSSAYALASEVMAGSFHTEDAQEGVASFLEKRRPRFTDR